MAGKENKEEREANNFAMELLMPEDFIKMFIAKMHKTKKPTTEEKLVKAIAKGFDVSEQAAQARLVDLGVLTCI